MNNLRIKSKLVITLVYVHLLADVQSEGYVPAFTVSLCESEAPASSRMHIVFFVRVHLRKTINFEVTFYVVLPLLIVFNNFT